MTLQTAIDQGLTASQKGDLDAALAFFTQAKQLDPSHYKALLYSGFTLLMQGRFDEALSDFHAALPLTPSDPDLHDYMGRCYMGLGETGKAVEHFKKAASVHSQTDYVADGALVIPAFRFKHDLEQLTALDQKSELDETAQKSLAAFRAVWSETDSQAQVVSIDKQSTHFNPVSYVYQNRIHLEPGAAVSGAALNGDLDGDALSDTYESNAPQILVIDDFLSPTALQALREYCNYSTMWRRDMAGGYLSSTLPEGFACPLIFQVSDELSQLLPRVIKDHRLSYAWGFKYDSTLNGVAMHADDAVVNVNFWITDDDANQSPDTGGLVIWDKKPPVSWAHEAYNNVTNLDAIRDFLVHEKANGIRIPHRANRAVVFDSDLFHETDQIDFKDDYFSRRVNITFLYGLCRAARSQLRR